MEDGDVFYIKVLHKTLAYEVDQILTVKPEEYQSPADRKRKRLCDAGQCTPYAINTHRLLVGGRGSLIKRHWRKKAASQQQITSLSHCTGRWTCCRAVILLSSSEESERRRRSMRRKKINFIILSVLCLLLWVQAPVLAEETGSIHIKAQVEKDEEHTSALSGCHFVMYHVGDYEDGEWVTISPFKSAGTTFQVEDAEENYKTAQAFKGYAKKQNLEGTQKITDGNGELTYSPLVRGVYLIYQTQTAYLNEEEYESEPFIVTVPGYEETGTVWNITVEPKFRNNSIEEKYPTDSENTGSTTETDVHYNKKDPDIKGENSKDLGRFTSVIYG
jgi:hypothetical protein